MTIPIQRVGGCRENFTVNVADPVRSRGIGTGYLTGEPERTRYAPGVHAFRGATTGVNSDPSAPTSIAAPVQT